MFLSIVKEQELVDVQKAAKLLGMSPKTIRKWARLKVIKGFKVGPRGDWRFKKDELFKILKEYKRGV